MTRQDHSQSPDHRPDFWQPNAHTTAAGRIERAQRDYDSQHSPRGWADIVVYTLLFGPFLIILAMWLLGR